MMNNIILSVTMAVLVMVMMSKAVNGQSSACPNSTDILSCTCQESGSAGLIELDCFSREINDLRASQILDVFLSSTEATNSLEWVYFYNNLITRVPDQIKFFPRLVYITLNYNLITSIESGTFNFSSTLDYLGLDANQIVSIEPGTFQGEYGEGSTLRLDDNGLTRLESAVFQSMLEKMEPFSGLFTQVSLVGNPFDCSDDLCHLAWLIRDNRQLLKATYGATCSNGTYFERLNPNGFGDC